jgi:hypothetical protein
MGEVHFCSLSWVKFDEVEGKVRCYRKPVVSEVFN